MNSKVRIFLIAVVLAVMLWMVNHLNQSFTIRVAFIVSYESSNTVYQSDSLSNSLVYAEVSGSGFSMLKYYFEQPQTLMIQNSDFALQKKGDTLLYTLAGSKLQKIINDILPTGIICTSPPTDTVAFTLLSYPSKDVPISVPLQVSMAEGFMLSGPIKTYPKTIRISGPASVLFVIDTLHSETVMATNINDTIRINKRLIIPEKINTSVKDVAVLIPVSRIKQIVTEKKYKFEIDGNEMIQEIIITSNIPEGSNESSFEIRHFIENERIVFKVSMNNHGEVVSVVPESIPLPQ